MTPHGISNSVGNRALHHDQAFRVICSRVLLASDQPFNPFVAQILYNSRNLGPHQLPSRKLCHQVCNMLGAKRVESSLLAQGNVTYQLAPPLYHGTGSVEAVRIPSTHQSSRCTTWCKIKLLRQLCSAKVSTDQACCLFQKLYMCPQSALLNSQRWLFALSGSGSCKGVHS